MQVHERAEARQLQVVAGWHLPGLEGSFAAHLCTVVCTHHSDAVVACSAPARWDARLPPLQQALVQANTADQAVKYFTGAIGIHRLLCSDQRLRPADDSGQTDGRR